MTIKNKETQQNISSQQPIATPTETKQETTQETAQETMFKQQQFKKFKRAKMPREGSFEHFTPDLDEGLSEEQVKTRFKQFLFNHTEKKYSKSYFSIFTSNPLTVFNALALLVAIALMYSGAGITQYTFALIFIINATVAIVQEIIAKRKIDKLSLISSPTAKVIRGGIKKEIPAKEIVVDDVILLETGQQIPVDCVACDGTAEVNESLLTGESDAVKKNEGDTLYAGSFVVSGNCRARVKKVGKETYVSKLTAKAKKYKKPNSEIKNSTNTFIAIVACLMVPIAFGIFSINLPDPFSWEALVADLPELIQSTSAVVIGMIPSGMFLLASIAMATGIIRLAKNNTLVNDMYSLEMLARVDVLCLDKTGTITDGKMQVNDVTLLNSYTSYSLDEIMGSMLAALDDNNQTSIALYNKFGHSAALRPKKIIPFSSARKLSAVSFHDVGTFVMGAPEFVLRPMPTRVEKLVLEYAQKGLRVLVLAYSSNAISGERLPGVLRPMALISLSDNIRDDATDTIQWFKDNDVQVKIISGDNPVTVSEVARRAGVDNADKFLSLEGLTNLEVENAAAEYTVFGRVTPEQKALLVKALKKQGRTVAMTGDGVNDILAMKESDCAISVAAGSEAARNVSNLVLQDNNFANMPKVVYEGRRVINNVKNTSSLYIMKTLFTAIVAVICILLGRQYFFKTNNLLLFELMIAGVPSVILSVQPSTQRIQGKYFSYVLCHAIPAALTMVVCVMAMYVASMIQFGEFVLEYQALAVMALTLSGVVMLYRQCQPFNLLRAVTFTISAVACVIAFAIPVIADIIFDQWIVDGVVMEFSLSGLLLLVCTIQAAVPISQWLLKLFNGMANAVDKNA